jgi:hypothetical protein
MTATDAPDWQTIVTLQTGGSVTDAPDWTDVVTGPGGVQPVVAGGSSWMSLWGAAGLVGVSLNPIAVFNTNVGLLGGTLYLIPFVALSTATVSQVYVPAAATVVLTPTTSYVGLYDFGQATSGTFTLLATSASGAFATTIGSNTGAPTTVSPSTKLTAGEVYVAAVQPNGNTINAWGYTGNSTFPTTPNFSTAPLWAQGGGGSGGGVLPPTMAFSTVFRSLRNGLVYVN